MGALVDAVGAVVVAPNTILPVLIHAGYEPVAPVWPAGPVDPFKATTAHLTGSSGGGLPEFPLPAIFI